MRAEGGGNEPSGGAQLDFELDRQRDRAGVCLSHDAHTAPAYRELCVGAVRLLGAFAAAGDCDVGCVGVYEPVACCKPAWVNISLKQKKRHPPPRQNSTRHEKKRRRNETFYGGGCGFQRGVTPPVGVFDLGTTGTCVLEKPWGSSSRWYKPDSKWHFFSGGAPYLGNGMPKSPNRDVL